MKTSLVLTTINKTNQNIKNISLNSKKIKWDLIIIGDKKSPKNFKLKYGKYFSYNQQKKLNLSFAKKCPANNYARKNIGYLISIIKKNKIIVETDDDNFPKKKFFSKKKIIHKVNTIQNKNWINIYDLFVDKKNKGKIWPRGLPLTEINKNKIRINKKKNDQVFYLQQGVCEKNPDVDAIYRLLNKKIDIKFKNFKIDLGKSISTFNSQNTIWFDEIFPLMYLPVTCPMRCTDILRSLIAQKILYNDKKKILFFGTTMFQNRNLHNLNSDFEQEIPMYLNNHKIYELLKKIKIK